MTTDTKLASGDWTSNIVFEVTLDGEESKQSDEDNLEEITLYGSDLSKYNLSIDENGSLVVPEIVTDSEGNKFKVISIGKSAFSGCTSLTSITIPDSVTSIGNGAFYDCKSLTSITIPNSVTSIGERAFNGCTGFTSVNIPSSVTSIGNCAFGGCSSLMSINVNKNNTVYNSNNDCNAIIETETNTLLVGCKNTIIPNTVTSIGDSAFSNYTSLTSITIPNSVTSIGYCAFYGCTGLTEIIIPNTVTSIGNLAFIGCTGLTSITIPEGVTRIGESAFNYCPRLNSVTIPNSVTSIGRVAFSSCYNLTNITWNGTKYTDKDTFNNALKTAGIATSDVWT